MVKSSGQFRRQGFNPWSGKIPHARELLSLCTTATEPACPRAHAPQQEAQMSGFKCFLSHEYGAVWKMRYKSPPRGGQWQEWETEKREGSGHECMCTEDLTLLPRSAPCTGPGAALKPPVPPATVLLSGSEYQCWDAPYRTFFTR